MTGLSAREIGLRRDSKIIETIEKVIALTAEQVRVMFFPYEQGLRKAQERLRKLYKSKKLNRTKLEDNSYVYYIGKKRGDFEHLVGTNWFYVWFISRKCWWEEIERWDLEQDYGILRCDGFMAVKNTVTEEHNFYFVEYDRSNNKFDKVRKYVEFYEQEKYEGFWWVEYTKKFPVINIITTDEQRLQVIQDDIKEENTAGLRFKTCLVDEMKEVRRSAS